MNQLPVPLISLTTCFGQKAAVRWTVFCYDALSSVCVVARIQNLLKTANIASLHMPKGSVAQTTVVSHYQSNHTGTCNDGSPLEQYFQRDRRNTSRNSMTRALNTPLCASKLCTRWTYSHNSRPSSALPPAMCIKVRQEAMRDNVVWSV